jgi:CMP-N,N'-diacetyllegionaminic acid synthase
MTTLAVIPARGGSKGVPLKNLFPLAGTPLIVHTIREARRSRHINRLVVSTDSSAIADVSRRAGAEVVMRPAELATDEAATELALIHALDWLHDADGFAPDLVLTLEPTSPLRTARLIDVCVETLLADNTADSVVTVTETRDCLGTVHDGRFAHLDPTQPRRRQDRQPLYKETAPSTSRASRCSGAGDASSAIIRERWSPPRKRSLTSIPRSISRSPRRSCAGETATRRETVTRSDAKEAL